MTGISNFHSHTELCNHAKGLPSDYAKQAALEGCTALGISDHCPYPSSFKDAWPSVRMSVEQVGFYTDEINRARDMSPFPVYMGFECEYDKNFRAWYEDDLLGKFKAQYLVLGSHWVTIGDHHVSCGQINNNSDLNRYIDQTIDGMRTGLFAFLAHPDMFMWQHKVWDDQAKSCLGAILDAAIDLNMPLEINGLGMSREPVQTPMGVRYPYPSWEFWETVAQSKALVICNSDAHSPLDVIFNARKARDFASGLGITPIEKINCIL